MISQRNRFIHVMGRDSQIVLLLMATRTSLMFELSCRPFEMILMMEIGSKYLLNVTQKRREFFDVV